MRSVILSQWRERRMGIIRQDLRALNDSTGKSSGSAGDEITMGGVYQGLEGG